MNRNAQGMADIASHLVREARVKAEALGFVDDDAKGVAVFGSALAFAMLTVLAGVSEAEAQQEFRWARDRAVGAARLFVEDARRTP